MRDPTHVAWGEFLDDLVHELRAPLTAVGGYASLLAGDDLPAEVKEAAATIEAQAGRLGAQLEALLEIARLWSGRTALLRERTNLAALLHTLGNMYHVPVEAPRNMWAKVDAPLLRRATGELIANAIQHGEPPVGLALIRADATLGIHVEDSGGGISDRHVAGIGRRPFMAGNDDARRTGRGMGLLFAAAVAEAHDGGLFYRRDDGITRLILELPTV